MSVPTYIRWESGHTKRLPARQALKLLANALNVTVEDIESAIVTARANAREADSTNETNVSLKVYFGPRSVPMMFRCGR
jgi:transcriptional regulator with XRE-family HTH domain